MKRKLNKKKYEGFELITTPESGVITFGTNVWVREEPFGVIINFPAGQTLKILPEEEAKKENLNSLDEAGEIHFWLLMACFGWFFIILILVHKLSS